MMHCSILDWFNNEFRNLGRGPALIFFYVSGISGNLGRGSPHIGPFQVQVCINTEVFARRQFLVLTRYQGVMPVGILHMLVLSYTKCVLGCRILFGQLCCGRWEAVEDCWSVSLISYCATGHSLTNGFPNTISCGWEITRTILDMQMTALHEPSAQARGHGTDGHNSVPYCKV